MCPPAPIPSAAIELDIYSTDETICKLLMQLQSGHTPPQNVLSDVDPYQYPPSNLPADMWYFSSGSKIDTKFGFWRSTGEACKVYSTTLIVGLRKTLQFYEGPVHNLQKTNWMMQEYTTTELYTSKLDPRALCRVFLVDDSSSGGFKNEHLVKNIDDVAVAGPSDVANQSLDQVLEDYVSEGDYLELDDLATPLSRTTSSADSSCMTMSSEELFDSDALLRELGDDIVDQEVQDSRIKLNLSAPAELTQVVMQPTTLGSVDQVNESEPCTGQTSETNPTTEDKGTPNEADTAPPPPLSSPPPPPLSPPPLSPPPLSPTPLSQLPSSSTAPPPPSQPPLPPSSSNNRTKRRKMIKYLCFLAF